MYRQIIAVVMVLVLCAASVYALMPPQVYRQKIIDSPFKATAEVISVKVIKSDPAWVQKLVWFKLIKSYGPKEPPEKFAAYCFSAGEKPLLGGKIYFYPKVGQKVYVTTMGQNLEITSYTTLTDELQNALDKAPEKIKLGVGTVSVE